MHEPASDGLFADYAMRQRYGHEELLRRRQAALGDHARRQFGLSNAGKLQRLASQLNTIGAT